MRSGSLRRLLAGACGLAAVVGTGGAATAIAAIDPAVEGQNFAKTEERNTYITKTPEFQARLARQNAEDNADLAAIAAEEAPMGADARNFTGNICFQRKQECAGDVRYLDWASSGFGMAEPVQYTARSGATISGTVWATDAGPAKRPGIVITTGSVQAPETLYWPIAAVLAKRGYVVLTYDVQGQGRSDTFGAPPDDNEGFPSQAGQPFYDGTEDALDFLLSTPAKPYEPRPSCGNANGGTGTDHSDKHQRRLDAGLHAAHNPFWKLVDAERIGIAGHSLGAGAVSYIGQIDDRVDAIVAWDNLGTGSSHPDCPSGSAPRPDDPPLTKPAIGMSNDYGLVATPKTPGSPDPDPQGPNGAFQAFKDAGVDSMQVNRRGGTHYEYSFIPGETAPPLGLATFRGMDMAIWYTAAWFDKYVKCQGDAACEAEADRLLLTDRWRDDTSEGQVDVSGDPNLYSFYTRSRYDVTDADGDERACEDMRQGCNSMGPDGLPPGYFAITEANTIDEARGPGGGGGGGGGGGDSQAPPCSIAQVGTAADDGPDTLQATDAGDTIRGRRGDDRIRGGRGDDCLYGNGGGDVVKGDEGDDEVRGGGGRDRVVGGEGDDEVRANRGRDVAKGGRGADMINGGRGRDRVVGGRGRDRLAGGDGNDVIKADDGRRDIVICNKGRRDKVIADRKDEVGRACDRVRIVDSGRRGGSAPRPY